MELWDIQELAFYNSSLHKMSASLQFYTLPHQNNYFMISEYYRWIFRGSVLHICQYAGSFLGGVYVDKLNNIKLKVIIPGIPKENSSAVLFSTVQILLSLYSQSAVRNITWIHFLKCIKLNFILKLMVKCMVHFLRLWEDLFATKVELVILSLKTKIELPSLYLLRIISSPHPPWIKLSIIPEIQKVTSLKSTSHVRKQRDREAYLMWFGKLGINPEVKI